MKIGVFLFHESRYPSADAQIIDEAVREAKLAEDEGMDAVFLAEHHFDGNCAYVDPPTFAAALAMATSRIKIGFAVLQTSLYHPIRMAEQISLIDNLSKGRLIVGLGRGSMVNMHEYSGYQIEPESAQDRFEEIEKILALPGQYSIWRRSEPASAMRTADRWDKLSGQPRHDGAPHGR